MPITYEINSDPGVVFTTATGTLTDDELMEHKRKLIADTRFKPGMVELSDTRGVEKLGITPKGIDLFASHDITCRDRFENYKLAIVVSQDYVFGMARMYQLQTEKAISQMCVFRDMTEARNWLGLVPER